MKIESQKILDLYRTGESTVVKILKRTTKGNKMKIKTSRRITTAIYRVAFYAAVATIVGGYVAAKVNKE